MTLRLDAAAGEALNRERSLTFSLDGRDVQCLEGDTIGSAMAAAGVTVIARSFKYHRPRGLFCMSGACAGCMIRVDGVPNVQACQTLAKQGMRVARQNGLPSVDFDLMRAADRFSFFLPVGFYYKAFYRPRFVWPLVEPFIRRAAGIGEAPSEKLEHRRYEAINLHPDVLVVGGGPAGLGAAIEAAKAGARTMLVESAPALGGRLRFAFNRGNEPRHALAGRLSAEVEEAGVDVRTSATAFGIFEDRLAAVAAPEGLLRVRPRELVIATGGLEQPLLFGNADLPGVMLAGAVERLINLYRVLPGKVAVVLTGSDRGYETALSLLGAGARVTILDWRTGAAGPVVDAAVAAGADVRKDAVAIGAKGGKRVRSLDVRIAGAPQQLTVDLVVIAGQVVPASGLLAQSGASSTYDEELKAFVPDRLPDGIHAAGGVLGESDSARSLVMGRLAGLAAAEAALRTTEVAAAVGTRRSALGVQVKAEGRAPVVLPADVNAGAKTFTCLCMDVTTKEMELAVEEGFDSIELLKRYTALGMGPCQGKSCLAGCVRYAARLTNRTNPETGVPTARAPWRPVELGLLAADHLEPRKESPLHECHVDLGAEFTWAGEWRRPRQYRDPVEECRAVHERVAIIDVSTLGKYLISGSQAVDLLEKLYPNRYADLKVGRIRYGAMLNDQGVILDDGTVGRLDENEFFVTTTTSGADAIDQWIKWWMADWRLQAHVVNMSSAYAAINVAGPQSRELMSRLTDADLSVEALPYLKLAQARIAGVPSLILRIGFVGELSYEVHFPSAFAEHVWSAMLTSGADLGILPFGLETQRILRLEKQHIIVGQDTDALSTPEGAGLGWMVKLDKQDFLGRQALADDSEKGTPERLVGFKVESGGLPTEGVAVVSDGQPIGRVCSSRWSETAGAFIGLAWVPTAMAQDGARLELGASGTRTVARVHLKPFFDPDGVRLRS